MLQFWFALQWSKNLPLSLFLKNLLTGLSQRVAYFYPTGVTLLHTSSPSSLRARLRIVARARVCVEVAWTAVAGWGLVRHRTRLHQPWRRAQPGQEERPSPEPRIPGRGAAVVAWQGGSTDTAVCSVCWDLDFSHELWWMNVRARRYGWNWYSNNHKNLWYLCSRMHNNTLSCNPIDVHRVELHGYVMCDIKPKLEFYK